VSGDDEKHSYNVQKNGSVSEAGLMKVRCWYWPLFGDRIAHPKDSKMVTHFVFGSHERMKELERRIQGIALSGMPVLIEGASGTGKQTLVELLHDASGSGSGLTRVICRKSGSGVCQDNVPVNFTADLGEVYARTRGTLFLKNVHLLSPREQEQLLAALERGTGSYGESNPMAGSPRLLSTADEWLDPFGSHSEFNPALYYRLSAHRILLPRLRERREDIAELFETMVRGAANGNGAPPPCPPRLLGALRGYDWPGNLRELQNIARTYILTGRAEEIIAELSSRELSNHRHLSAPAIQVQWDNRPLKEQVKVASRKLESEIILGCLERHQWNRRRAAASLRISYRSLLYKMKNCNLRLRTNIAREEKGNR
jgi:two-component system response regulator AtoC